MSSEKLNNLSPSQLEEFADLQKQGKKLAAEGKLHDSLRLFEQARQICETPKLLQRIQKLKDFIQKVSVEKIQNQTLVVGKQSLGTRFHSSEGENFVAKKSFNDTNANRIFKEPIATSNVLGDIQNVEKSIKHSTIENPQDLTPESLAKFKKLKKTAIELSYEGKFQEALENFREALKICSCPKVKKHAEGVEFAIAKHSNELEKFQNLTEIGKKLASEGKQTESLQRLKDAFLVCPSPKISKMIETIKLTGTPFASKEGMKFPGTSCTKSCEDIQEENLSSVARIQSVSKENLKFPDSSHIKNFIQEGDPSNVTSLQSISNKIIEYPDTTSNIQTKNSEVIQEENFTVDPFISPKANISDPDSLSPERLEKYKSLYKSARQHAADGKLREALSYLNEAKSICESDKVLKRIKDIEQIIKNSDDDNEKGDQMVLVADEFHIFHEIYEKLYPYQREGVAWMWSLFKKRKGGVLGDDMGLGKTFQVIAFLSGLIDADLVKHILIIMPVSLLPNWEREFKKWCPGISVHCFHGSSKKERERNLLRVQRRGQVLLTSYGMILSNIDSLTSLDGEKFVWDYVILDEGHKIKNPTKTTKAVHDLPSKNRIVLTGTPVQNNLRELWALYDFAHQGTLLGSLKTFKMQYENIITRSREKDATIGEKRLGTEMADNLKTLIKPYFLRRSKDEIWGDGKLNAKLDDLEKEMKNLQISDQRLNTRKNDLIIWLFMSESQCEIYSSFLHSEAVKNILVSKRSPLVELTTLKKICDHPRLLSKRACIELGLYGELKEEELQKLNEESIDASSIEGVSDETLINESGKMKFLINLLENLRENNHRTLVFSLSRKILDMIHRILVNKQWKVLRIDGTISKIEERERRIQLFQKDHSYSVFLLTTQVGGIGITLTAADRVIIFDPSWNPATDAQAVDRAYRIGQQKDVIVYRLITCGSVEEKIYRRQIFKDSLTRQATSVSDPYRYFSKQELRELFILENPRYSATQVQLSQMHSNERKTDVSLDEHIAFLHSLDIFGISDHDLMFTKTLKDPTEDNDESAVCNDYIKRQVATAQQLIQAEASIIEEGIRLTGSYSRPFLEPIPTFKRSTEKDTYKPPLIADSVDSIPQTSLSSKSYSNIDVYVEDINADNSTKVSPTGKKFVDNPKTANGGVLDSNALGSSGEERDAYKPNKITNYYAASEPESKFVFGRDLKKSFSCSPSSSRTAEKKLGPFIPEEKKEIKENMTLFQNTSSELSTLELRSNAPEFLNRKDNIESGKTGISLFPEAEEKHTYASFTELISSNETNNENNKTIDIIDSFEATEDEKNEVSVSNINDPRNLVNNANYVTDKFNEENMENPQLNILVCKESFENTGEVEKENSEHAKLHILNYKKSFQNTDEIEEESTNFSTCNKKTDSSFPEAEERNTYTLFTELISSNETNNENNKTIDLIDSFGDTEDEKNKGNVSNISDSRNLVNNANYVIDKFNEQNMENRKLNILDCKESCQNADEVERANTENTKLAILDYKKSFQNTDEIEEESVNFPTCNAKSLGEPLQNSLTDEKSCSKSLSPEPEKNFSFSKSCTHESKFNDSAKGNDIVFNENTSLQISPVRSSPGKDSKLMFFKTSSPLNMRKLQNENDRTRFLNESLSFDDELNYSPLKGRKSCARPTEFIPESDSSQQTSCPSSANTSAENIVESENEFAVDDSLPNSSGISAATDDNSLDTSVVPSSLPNTPATVNKIQSITHMQIDRSKQIEQSKCYSDTHSSFVSCDISTRTEGNIKRITPLRITKRFNSQEDTPFAKAVAASPVFSSHGTLCDSETDSPIAVIRRKKKQAFVSDSECSSSENEDDASVSVFYSESSAVDLISDNSRGSPEF